MLPSLSEPHDTHSSLEEHPGSKLDLCQCYLFFTSSKPLDTPQCELNLNTLTTSASLLSRTGFPTRLKCKKVGIDKEKMSRMIVREKLSKRAVVKEDGLGWVYLQERRLTPIGT